MVLTENMKYPGSNVISTASTEEPMELASINGADDTFLDGQRFDATAEVKDHRG